jgi:ABC-2 type transport system permease protein
MNPTVHAVRLGLARGWVETRHSLTNPQDLGWNVFVVTVFVVVLLFQRNARVEGSALSLAMLTLPSILGMWVAVGGYTGAAGTLAVEREDGTLLRAKAVPQGMVGYLAGRIVSLSLITAFTLVIIFAAGLVLLPELAGAVRSGWPTLTWVVALGLLATMPWGAVVGSLVKSPNSAFGLTMLPVIGLTAISGIFYPIATLPGWVQGVAQAFPIYWLGLGIRSGLLPDAAAALEISGSWRHLETAGVLGAWAVAGLLVAPTVLRRMARRESGSTMEARRQQHLQRTP